MLKVTFSTVTLRSSNLVIREALEWRDWRESAIQLIKMARATCKHNLNCWAPTPYRSAAFETLWLPRLKVFSLTYVEDYYWYFLREAQPNFTTIVLYVNRACIVRYLSAVLDDWVVLLFINCSVLVLDTRWLLLSFSIVGQTFCLCCSTLALN